MLERDESTEPGPRRDWLLLGLLVLLVLPLRCWLLYSTETIARDGIGYIRYALAFEHKAWPQVWREQDQHPGYPLTVWAASIPVRSWSGRTDPATMQLSAQLVSLVAALLLLYPMYHLGRLLLGRPAGFWGCLLYQCLPVSGHHLSDGISEALFLLLLVSALLQAVRAVQSHAPGRFALCGLFSGLAYLTRPEGLLVLPAVALVLLVQQYVPAWRCSWRRWLACATSLAVVAGAVGSIYVVTTGHITNKPSAHKVMELAERPGRPEKDALACAGPMILFAATYTPSESLNENLAHSSRCLVDELNQGFHYLGIYFTIPGLWWTFDGLRRRPGFWVVCLYSLIHAFILLALGVVAYYVSDRHTTVLVLLGSFLVAVGLRELPVRWRRSSGVWSLLLLMSFLGFCLVKTARPLHADRAANHAAGLWLAEQKARGAIKVGEGDIILDDHYFSHFYAGGLFDEQRRIVVPPQYQPWAYKVQTRTKGQRLEAGEVVYHWPAQGNIETARVVVLKRPRDKKENPW